MTIGEWIKAKAWDYTKRGPINLIWGKGGRSMGYPTHDVLTTTETPTERDLKRLRLDQIFVSRINTLRMIEARWDLFRQAWDDLVKEYGKIGFMHSPHLDPEFSMAKSGAKHIDKRLGARLVAKNAGYQKVINAINAKLEKGAERLGLGNIDAVDLRIDLPKKEAIETKYFVPPTVPIRYYASWMNDKDDLLSDYDVSYYGFEAVKAWTPVYVQVVKDIIKEARTKLNIKKEVKKDKDDNELPQDNLSKLETAALQILDMIMQHIWFEEKKWYDYRKIFVGYQDKIKDTPNKVGSKELPNKIMDICFHRTYKVVSPRQIMGQEWYFNPTRFLERLNRINKILEPSDRVDLIVEGERISDLDAVIGFGTITAALVDIRKRLAEAKRRKDNIRKTWLERKKSDYEAQRSSLAKQKAAYDRFWNKYEKLKADKKISMEENITNKVSSVINAVNTDMDRDLEGFRNTLTELKRLLGDEFPFIAREDIRGWTAEEERLLDEGQLIPGLDENGWPLEVIDAGEEYVFLGKSLRDWGLTVNNDYGFVLVDLFDLALGKRTTVRQIKKKHIEDMDVLLWATTIHNEFDAIRDDLRDGRYHPDSLTIIDYIMARKKIGPEKWRVPEIRNEWQMIGEGALMNDSTVKAFREDIKMTKADGTELKVKGTGKRGRKARSPTDLIPAFDLRALRLLGSATGDISEEALKFKHLGRKYYYDPAARISAPWGDIKTLRSRGVSGDVIREFNKYIGPAITSRGVSMYIVETIALSIADFEQARGRLKDWSRNVYYDLGPRAFNKDGPKDPFDLRATVADGNAEIQERISKAAELDKAEQEKQAIDMI